MSTERGRRASMSMNCLYPAQERIATAYSCRIQETSNGDTHSFRAYNVLRFTMRCMYYIYRRTLKFVALYFACGMLKCQPSNFVFYVMSRNILTMIDFGLAHRLDGSNQLDTYGVRPDRWIDSAGGSRHVENNTSHCERRIRCWRSLRRPASSQVREICNAFSCDERR